MNIFSWSRLHKTTDERREELAKARHTAEVFEQAYVKVRGIKVDIHDRNNTVFETSVNFDTVPTKEFYTAMVEDVYEAFGRSYVGQQYQPYQIYDVIPNVIATNMYTESQGVPPVIILYDLSPNEAYAYDMLELLIKQPVNPDSALHTVYSLPVAECGVTIQETAVLVLLTWLSEYSNLHEVLNILKQHVDTVHTFYMSDAFHQYGFSQKVLMEAEKDMIRCVIQHVMLHTWHDAVQEMHFDSSIPWEWQRSSLAATYVNFLEEGNHVQAIYHESVLKMLRTMQEIFDHDAEIRANSPFRYRAKKILRDGYAASGGSPYTK